MGSQSVDTLKSTVYFTLVSPASGWTKGFFPRNHPVAFSLKHHGVVIQTHGQGLRANNNTNNNK